MLHNHVSSGSVLTSTCEAEDGLSSGSFAGHRSDELEAECAGAVQRGACADHASRHAVQKAVFWNAAGG
eukprot:5725137-Pleurochrysis_carterae.AAC.3